MRLVHGLSNPYLLLDMKTNPIVNGVRFCGVIHGKEPRVFASIRLERRHTYGKHTAYGERTKWKALSYVDLGVFSDLALAKVSVRNYLENKRCGVI